MIGEGWKGLREAIRDMAEGYALTDPPNAYRYREEADRFRNLPEPANTETFMDRQSEAEELRRLWQSRYRKRKSSGR